MANPNQEILAALAALRVQLAGGLDTLASQMAASTVAHTVELNRLKSQLEIPMINRLEDVQSKVAAIHAAVKEKKEIA